MAEKRKLTSKHTELGNYFWEKGSSYPAAPYKDVNRGDVYRLVGSYADVSGGDKQKTIKKLQEHIKNMRNNEQYPKKPEDRAYWRKYAELSESVLRELERYS